MSSYKKAGVDLEKNSKLKEVIKARVRETFTKNVVGDIGLFGGLFDVSEFKLYEQPVLVASTDGVGTKLAVAKAMDKWDTVGMDLVNHCINDILVQGAKPLFFLDYMAAQRLEPKITSQIIKGLAAACKEAGVALIGGETAEMPGTYVPGEYDLAGTIIGVVEKKDIVDGSKIGLGDIIIGIPSSGLHTNGYSLARKALSDAGITIDSKPTELKTTIGEALLAPHRSYFSQVYPLRNIIKGMAHITGGGFDENIPRVLPKGLCANIDKKSWAVPPLFRLIWQKGGIAEHEMYRTFNMGIGMVLIVSQKDESFILGKIPGSARIGTINKGSEVRYV